MATGTFLLLLSLITLLSPSLSHSNCGHDAFDHKIQRNIHTSRPRENKNLFSHKRSLKTSLNDNAPQTDEYWDNIRIAYNTDGLLEGWTNHDFKHWFAQDVIPAAIDFLQKIIKVRPIDGNLTLERECNEWLDQTENKCIDISEDTSCSGYYDIEDYYFDAIYDCSNGEDDCELRPSGGGTAHDITLYFVGKSNSSHCKGTHHIYGYSSYCHSNVYDRPVAGFVNLCEQTLLDEGDYFTWEKAVTLVIHETFHVLGFSSTGFAYFRKNNAERTARTPRRGGQDSEGNVSDNFGHPIRGSDGRYAYGNDTLIYEYIDGREKEAAFIVLPTVKKVIRQFFDCEDMIGLELEDFGDSNSASSHWEQRIVSMEFMIGYISSAAPVSVFSMAVFADSGWYEMNWDYATVPVYGKGFGCDWYERKCIIDLGKNKVEVLDDSVYCKADVGYECAADYVGRSNCHLKHYENGELPDSFQYFAGVGGEDIGGVRGYADFCPMFYPSKHGDCRVKEGNKKYAELGDEICPSCKCNEMYSSDDSHHYSICHKTECVSNYLYIHSANAHSKSHNHYSESEFYNDYSDYTAVRIRIVNEDDNRYEYITCWRFESNEYKDTSYYSYFVKCPQFEDICYHKNPWICNGHGMVNPESTSVEDKCFCNHGYIGCDCTLMNTIDNKYNDLKIGQTCVEESSDAFGTAENSDLDSIGLVNVTMQFDDRYSIESILKTLRLWVAIDVRVHESNVWIESLYEQRSDNYSVVSIAYFDEQNQNKINTPLLVKEFHYLFNSENENKFVLFDIQILKEPTFVVIPSAIYSVVSILILYLGIFTACFLLRIYFTSFLSLSFFFIFAYFYVQPQNIPTFLSL